MSAHDDQRLMLDREFDLTDFCAATSITLADFARQVDELARKLPDALVSYERGWDGDPDEFKIRWQSLETDAEMQERLERDARWRNQQEVKRAALDALTQEQRDALGLGHWRVKP